MTTLDNLRHHKEEIDRLARLYGANDLWVFGSVARGEDTEESDIDVLVEMTDEASLLDLIRLQQALEMMLNRRADVLSAGGINPQLKDRILAEAVRL